MVSARGVDGEQLEQFIDAELKEACAPDGPGAAVILAIDGIPLVRKACGMAHVELAVPMRPEMVFRLGSVTKQFTAVAILVLMQRGALGLDDPVTRFLPDYPTHGDEITVRHLLTHTSGIRSYTSMPEFEMVMDRDATTREIIDFFNTEPLEFAPGTRHAYSNSGYALLGAIIERTTGLSYGDFVTRTIFGPLSMERSAYGSTGPLLSGRVAGYERNTEEWENARQISMTWPGAAGGLVSCIDDLLLWDESLYTGRLVPQEILHLAWTPATLPSGEIIDYGFGWFISDGQGHRCIEHGGGIHGFVSHLLRIPERHLFIAVLMNHGGHPADIAHRLAAQCLIEA